LNLLHWVKKENSGLFRSTLELATYEEKAGHTITLRQPTGNGALYGNGATPDVELVHSQLSIDSYYNGSPKFMWMHGEPLSSVGNGVSMKAIVDLAPMMDAFICMRKEEHIIWNSIKRTYYVPKGIDLELYHPIKGITQRLAGEPAVLYVENWRGQRNPLYLCVAMQEVWRKYPKARLHLVNCNNKKMHETFKALIANNKWWTFIRTLSPGVSPEKVNALYNTADIIVSCLYPLYARGIEAFGAGKAFIGPGYREDDYPFICDLQPESMADTIIKCWENYDLINYRRWAENHHDANETVRQSIEIYERYS
jgi:glycosyltransferase involved in cell wall biosynthesis